jgi:hypothetical protein
MKPTTRPPGTKQVLLPMGKHTPSDERGLYRDRMTTLTQAAYRPFLPLGLFVWGATFDSYVSAFLVGNQHEMNIGPGEPIPARYFSEGRSLDDLQRLADAGELELNVEQRQILETEVAETGQHLTVRMTGPFESVCLWGLTYAQRRPLLTQKIAPGWIEQDNPERVKTRVAGFQGQVIEHHLGGDRVISNVFAPSEESVCRLLVAARMPAGTF